MIILSFPPPAKPLNLNDRTHWAVKMRFVQAWRHAAHIAALDTITRGGLLRNQPFSIVQLSLPVKSLKVRRDAHNFVATCKPCLDGMVDAGVFEDDDVHHVAVMDPRFHEAKVDPLVSILIRPATIDGVL